jgi:heptosyltransferase-2
VRILVRGVNWLGDAVMTTPALLRLREANPAAQITLLTHDKLAELWRYHPAVDSVLSFSPRPSVWSVARTLRGGNFQVGLALPNSHRSALELWLARIPRRIGSARPWRNWLLTQRVPPPAGHLQMRKRSVAEIKSLLAARRGEAAGSALRGASSHSAHHLHHYLHLVAALGANPEVLAPLLAVGPDEVAAAKEKFSVANDALWVGLNPHAEYGPAKRWPAERFLAAATEIQNLARCRWLIFGGPADTAAATTLAGSLRQTFPSAPPLNLAGRTTLRELCALLKFCRVLLTNDSGPMHVAAAVGTPVVAIFGSTAPELTGPGLPGDPRHCLLRSETPCAPCFRRECPIDFRCMTSIRVERVVEAVLKVCRSSAAIQV